MEEKEECKERKGEQRKLRYGEEGKKREEENPSIREKKGIGKRRKWKKKLEGKEESREGSGRIWKMGRYK